MHLILMGPQGSGKGTQASRLAPRLGLLPIATGDLFRSAIKAGTPLGREVEATLARGELVADDVTIALVEERLDEIAHRREAGEAAVGALYDGFPRTQSQAGALDDALARRGEAVTAVVEIVVPTDRLVARLAGRRVCASCGEVYHVEYHPPRSPGVCDRCGGEVIQRPDDTPEAVQRRLDLYFAQTEPLLRYYRERGLLSPVDGDRPIERVTDDIVATVERPSPAASGGAPWRS